MTTAVQSVSSQNRPTALKGKQPSTKNRVWGVIEGSEEGQEGEGEGGSDEAQVRLSSAATPHNRAGEATGKSRKRGTLRPEGIKGNDANKGDEQNKRVQGVRMACAYRRAAKKYAHYAPPSNPGWERFGERSPDLASGLAQTVPLGHTNRMQ